MSRCRVRAQQRHFFVSEHDERIPRHDEEWLWKVPRPLFMREIEPLAREASWGPSPITPLAVVEHYRAITAERLAA